MTNRYSMRETMDVAKVASADIEKYLLSLPSTTDVINVEDDNDFRKYDIDLIHQVGEDCILIEVKGDRYHRTGNYFFETVSNKGKNTKGCFLYTSADFLYYYFVEEKELHILPILQTREWFLSNIDKFEEKTTSTSVGRYKSYDTIGRLVPRNLLRKNVNINIVKLSFIP